MVVTKPDPEDVRAGLADVPLIIEDLLCQVGLRADDSNPAVADLLAQVDLLRGR